MSASARLPIVLQCADGLGPKVRYVLDTLLCAAGVPVTYVDHPPSEGPWLFYGKSSPGSPQRERCVALAHVPAAWELFAWRRDVEAAEWCEGLPVVLADASGASGSWDASVDLLANAFYFLSSWPERFAGQDSPTRGLYADSVFARLGLPQDVVDRYLERLLARLAAVCERLNRTPWEPLQWPGGRRYAVVLSHDVDFLPGGLHDIVIQGGKTFLRHLVRQRDPADAVRSVLGLARAALRRRDPYGCVPEIIAREKAMGVRASFQVAVGHRHPNDVNYRIEDERVCRYLKTILDEGFELCLHGSYRSTENPQWYVEEAALLSERLGRPIGSRQHFLSFNYDALFRAQERAGIEYDMSVGYPDRTGPRAGFSFPYFPYCLEEDRPYQVLEIGLFLMDVTLRSYMGLKGAAAWQVIESGLKALRDRRGCASVVWHPIVFGGARDPGYDDLFWRMAGEIGRTGGTATDGRTINRCWRDRASAYPSFAAAR